MAQTVVLCIFLTDGSPVVDPRRCTFCGVLSIAILSYITRGCVYIYTPEEMVDANNNARICFLLGVSRFLRFAVTSSLKKGPKKPEDADSRGDLRNFQLSDLGSNGIESTKWPQHRGNTQIHIEHSRQMAYFGDLHAYAQRVDNWFRWETPSQCWLLPKSPLFFIDNFSVEASAAAIWIIEHIPLLIGH